MEVARCHTTRTAPTGRPTTGFATYQTRPGGTVWMLGDGTQRVAPIHVDDRFGVTLHDAAVTDL